MTQKEKQVSQRLKTWARNQEAYYQDELLFAKATSRIMEEIKRIKLAGKSDHVSSLYWLAIVATRAVNLLPDDAVRFFAKDRLLWPQLLTAFKNESRPGTPPSLGRALPLKIERGRGLDKLHAQVAAEIIERAATSKRLAGRALRMNEPTKLHAQVKELRALDALPALTSENLPQWDAVLGSLVDEYWGFVQDNYDLTAVNPPEVNTLYKRKNYFRKHVRDAVKRLLLVD